YSLLKFGSLHLPLTISLYPEVAAQCIHRFGSYTIQSHTLLKGLAVVLGTGVYLADHIHYLAQRNAAAKIAHAHHPIRYLQVHTLAMAHGKLINAIIYHLLHQYVDTIIHTAPVSQLAYVHTRAKPDMFPPIE